MRPTPAPLPNNEPKKLAPLRSVRFDEYVQGPSGASYHAIAMVAMKSLTPPRTLASAPKDALATLPGDPAQSVTLDRNGRLGLDQQYKSGDELSAVVALASLGLSEPFAKVKDAQTLAAIAERLAQLHTALSQAGDDATQARSACYSLLFSIALHAQAQGHGALHRQLATLCGERLRAEASLGARQFYTHLARQAVDKGEAPGFKGAEWLPDVSKPPYEKWKRDGVIRAQLYVDDDGTPRSRMERELETLGFAKQETRASGEIVYRRPAGATSGLPIEITLAPASKRPPVFEKAGDDSVDLLIYSGHAGYGATVTEALQGGVTSDGNGKLVVLYQCSGIYSADEIAKALPYAQLVSTTRLTSDATDMPMLRAMLSGFDRLADWSSIHKDVQTAVKGVQGEDWSRQYFYPNQAEGAEASIDRDGDGVDDAADRLFSLVNETHNLETQILSGAGQANGTLHTNASAFTRALSNVSLVLRNCPMFDETTQKKLGWNEPFVTDGLFEDAGVAEAFRFLRDADGRVHIALNARYAAASQVLLSHLLAVDLARYMAARASLSAPDTAAFALAMVERVRHQTKNSLDGLGNRLFFSRYGWDPEVAAKAIGAAGDPEDFAATHLAQIKRALGGASLAAAPQLPTSRSAALSLSMPQQAFGWPEPVMKTGNTYLFARGGKLVSAETWQDATTIHAVEVPVTPAGAMALMAAQPWDPAVHARVAESFERGVARGVPVDQALTEALFAAPVPGAVRTAFSYSMTQAYRDAFAAAGEGASLSNILTFARAFAAEPTPARRSRAGVIALAPSLNAEQRRAAALRLFELYAPASPAERSAALALLGLSVGELTVLALAVERPEAKELLARAPRTGNAEQQVIAAMRLVRRRWREVSLPYDIAEHLLTHDEADRVREALGE